MVHGEMSKYQRCCTKIKQKGSQALKIIFSGFFHYYFGVCVCSFGSAILLFEY